MKIKGKTKRFLIVTIICSYFATISSAFAFVWPVINFQKISTTVKNINTMISNITNVTGQVKTTVGKINAIGDVIGSIQKFADDIKTKISEIKKQVMEVVSAVKSAVETVKKAVEDIQTAITETTEAIKGLVDETVKTVENLIDDGATKEEVIDTVETAEQEAEKTKQDGLDNIDKQGQDISETLDKAGETLREMVDVVNEYDGIGEEQKAEFSERAKDIEKRIDELKVNLDDVINNAKENYNEQFSMFVTAAFDEYTQAINDYYSGKISKEELQKAGEKLNQSVSTLDVQIDNSLISDIVDATQAIANDIEALENDILDTISNNKDYSDEASNNLILDKEIRYSFSYSFQKDVINAEIIQSDDGRFLISKEFDCDENLIEKSVDKPMVVYEREGFNTLDMSKFLDGVNKAKTEVEFWGEQNPYENECYNKPGFAEEGVYVHIKKDYSLANIANVSQTKQYATNWITSEKEGYNKLVKDVQKNGDSNKNAESQKKLVDLEIPRAWNFIRRVDSLSRAKDMLDFYVEQKSTNLYATDRTGDYKYDQAKKEARGYVDVQTETSNGPTTDKVKLYPDVFLYFCNKEGSALYPTNDKSETELVDCMYKYAVGMSIGTDIAREDADLVPEKTSEGTVIPDYQLGIQEWTTRAATAASDSAFDTLAYSLVDNYNSIFVEKDSDADGTFKSYATKVSETTELRDEYITGAMVNGFGIHQILDLVDSGAQVLQTEILIFLPELEYNYFEKDIGEGGGQS